MSAVHRRLTPSSEPCEACRRQMRAVHEEVPHARLMVMSSTPLAEALGGGVETRYVCIDCGHVVIHSSGHYGTGWH